MTTILLEHGPDMALQWQASCSSSCREASPQALASGRRRDTMILHIHSTLSSTLW